MIKILISFVTILCFLSSSAFAFCSPAYTKYLIVPHNCKVLASKNIIEVTADVLEPDGSASLKQSKKISVLLQGSLKDYSCDKFPIKTKLNVIAMAPCGSCEDDPDEVRVTYPWKLTPAKGGVINPSSRDDRPDGEMKIGDKSFILENGEWKLAE